MSEEGNLSAIDTCVCLPIAVHHIFICKETVFFSLHRTCLDYDLCWAQKHLICPLLRNQFNFCKRSHGECLSRAVEVTNKKLRNSHKIWWPLNADTKVIKMGESPLLRRASKNFILTFGAVQVLRKGRQVVGFCKLSMACFAFCRGFGLFYQTPLTYVTFERS